MGALGDVAGALAPAAQGISAGQLAGAQEQLQHQQYLDSLGLEKQKAQHQAKEFDLRQKEFELSKQRDQGAAIDTVLGELSAEANRTPENDLDVAHIAHVRALRDRVAAKRINGDVAGAAWELQHADNHGANNGTLLGLAPAPPGPTSQADQGGGASAPSTPTAATSAQPAQPAIPPEFAQALAGLIPGLGLAQQGAQAFPGPAAQAMQAAQVPGQNGQPTAIPPQIAQIMAGLLGTGSPANAQTAIPNAQAATPNAPQFPAAVGNSPIANLLMPTMASLAVDPSMAPSAGPTPATVNADSLAGSAPSAAQSIETQAFPTGGDKYAGFGLNSFQRGQMDAAEDSKQAGLKEQGRARRPEERYADYNASQVRAEAQVKDARADQAKIVGEALAQQKEDRVAAFQLSNANAERMERAREANQRDKTLRYQADQSVKAAAARQGMTFEHWQQQDKQKDFSDYVAAQRAETQQNRAEITGLTRQLAMEKDIALRTQDRSVTSAFQSGGGGFNIGVPLELIKLGASGNLQVGQNQTLQHGIVVKMTPEMKQYITDAANLHDKLTNANAGWVPKSIAAKDDALGDNPATNAANKAIVDRGIASGNDDQFAAIFRKLAASEATRGKAKNLFEQWQAAHAQDGRPLPDGVGLIALTRGNAPKVPVTSTPPAIYAPSSGSNLSARPTQMGGLPPPGTSGRLPENPAEAAARGQQQLKKFHQIMKGLVGPGVYGNRPPSDFFK